MMGFAKAGNRCIGMTMPMSVKPSVPNTRLKWRALPHVEWPGRCHINMAIEDQAFARAARRAMRSHHVHRIIIGADYRRESGKVSQASACRARRLRIELGFDGVESFCEPVDKGNPANPAFWGSGYLKALLR